MQTDIKWLELLTKHGFYMSEFFETSPKTFTLLKCTHFDSDKMSSKYPEFYIVIDFLEYRFLCLRIFSIDAATHTLHRKANNI